MNNHDIHSANVGTGVHNSPDNNLPMASAGQGRQGELGREHKGEAGNRKGRGKPICGINIDMP